MDISNIETKLGFNFPKRHKAALLDLQDLIHDVCDFLVPESKYELLDFLEVNEFLHHDTPYDPWPDFLIAFASNRCGDYFAYDVRKPRLTIIYIDPHRTLVENLEARDKLKYDSFDKWHKSKITQQNFGADGG